MTPRVVPPRLLELPPGVVGTPREALLRACQDDVPLLEDPLFSNRAPWLDALCDRWGVPRGSYWCAGWAAEKWTLAGLPVPPITGAEHPWIVESWRRWAMATGRFFADLERVQLGDAVLYGAGGTPPATHLGAAVAGIVREMPGRLHLWDFEGNTSGDDTFSRNGELATCKPVDRARVIGFVRAERTP